MSQKASLGTDVAIGTLECFIPTHLEAMDPARIREFREATKTLRLQYHKEICSLIEEYQMLTSESGLGALKHRLIDLAGEKVEQTRRAYKQLKLETVLKSFGVALTPPALAASVASMLGTGIFVPAAIGATLALFTAQMLLNIDRARLEKEKSAWSYILDIEHQLT